jgi:hypothetical protein
MKKAAILIIISAVSILLSFGCVQGTPAGDSPPYTSSSPEDSSLPGAPLSEDKGRMEIPRGADTQEKFVQISKDQGYGMILLKSSELSLTAEKTGATLELYIKAEQVSGEIFYDDGQPWSLIVRDGDSVFLLLDDLYVQLGQVNYWYCWSYDKDAPYILVMVQNGAGIEELCFSYDSEKDVFYRESVFATEGNISVIDSSAAVPESFD